MLKTFAELAKFTEQEIAVLKSEILRNASNVPIGEIIRYVLAKNQFRSLVAINDFYTESHSIAITELRRVMLIGYETELKGRSEIAQHDNASLAIDYSIDEIEINELYKWPVLGHSIDEIAAHLARNAQFNIQSLISGPDRGEFPVEQLATRLEAEQLRFAQSLATSGTTAYLTGAQAARELIRGAIGAS